MTLKEQFDVVFDAGGNVKLCGRANTIKLMEMLEEKYPGEKFGDMIDGYMDIPAVLAKRAEA